MCLTRMTIISDVLERGTYMNCVGKRIDPERRLYHKEGKDQQYGLIL